MKSQDPESRSARAAAYRAAAEIARTVHHEHVEASIVAIAGRASAGAAHRRVRHAAQPWPLTPTLAPPATPSRETALDALCSARRALSLLRDAPGGDRCDDTRGATAREHPDGGPLDELPGGWPGGWLGERLSRLIEDCRAESRTPPAPPAAPRRPHRPRRSPPAPDPS